MKMYWVEVKLHYSWPRQYMEVSGQLQGFTSGERTHGTHGWAPEPVWTLHRREKSYRCRELKTCPSSPSLYRLSYPGSHHILILCTWCKYHTPILADRQVGRQADITKLTRACTNWVSACMVFLILVVMLCRVRGLYPQGGGGFVRQATSTAGLVQRGREVRLPTNHSLSTLYMAPTVHVVHKLYTIIIYQNYSAIVTVSISLYICICDTTVYQVQFML
jgi:hypothetical protein